MYIVISIKHQTTDIYQRNQLKVGKPLIVAILTENASFRSSGTFAYLHRAHIRNINMRSMEWLPALGIQG